MIITKEMELIINHIKKNRYYILTALDTTKRKRAIKRMVNFGMITIKSKTETYMKIERNWA